MTPQTFVHTGCVGLRCRSNAVIKLNNLGVFTPLELRCIVLQSHSAALSDVNAALFYVVYGSGERGRVLSQPYRSV